MEVPLGLTNTYRQSVYSPAPPLTAPAADEAAIAAAESTADIATIIIDIVGLSRRRRRERRLKDKEKFPLFASDAILLFKLSLQKKFRSEMIVRLLIRRRRVAPSEWLSQQVEKLLGFIRIAARWHFPYVIQTLYFVNSNRRCTNTYVLGFNG